MKTFRSSTAALLSLLVLAGCGAEQFGTTPQSSSESVSGLKSYEQLSCSSFTLIKPKVDILYVVDNSTSTYYVSSDIKTAITNTVNSISKEFDYRVIGTGLLPISGDSTPFNDYQLLTNSTDTLSDDAKNRTIISTSELSFFSPAQPGGSSEAGLKRITDFYNNNPTLFRENAYMITVLISNGRDTEIETLKAFANGETERNSVRYSERLTSLRNMKANLKSQDFRLFTVTAQSNCQDGYQSSMNSYVPMSKEFGPSDNIDLCQGGAISSIFSKINSTIKQVLVPHSYRYWPITFAQPGENVSFSEIQVYKVSGNNPPVRLDQPAWSYHKSTSGSEETRELPSKGERVSGEHFIKFSDGNLLTYPDCVQVRSTSKTETFGYVVIPQEPKPETLVLRINGQIIPRSSTNGWSYAGNKNQAINIKMPYPQAGDELPAVMKTGFMLQLNGSNNYYKSGDNVNADYIPAGI
jgi:hypothetical protein